MAVNESVAGSAGEVGVQLEAINRCASRSDAGEAHPTYVTLLLM